MSIPPQPTLHHLYSLPFYLNCTPDVLVSNLIFSRHSHNFNIFISENFHLSYVSLLPPPSQVHTPLVVSPLNCTFFLLLYLITSCHRLLPILFSIRFILPALSSIFTSLLQLPLSCTADSKYLYSFNLGHLYCLFVISFIYANTFDFLPTYFYPSFVQHIPPAF